MSRWTVFDRATAAAAQAPGRNIEPENNGGVIDALHAALQQQRAVVLVLPAGDERATVARVTPPLRPATVTPINEKQLRGPDVSYAPGGMLGLNESVSIEQESAAPEKKSWWTKMFQ
jgi:hypothetical protein